jgi:serine/threonine protein kinase/tetratricopeptide (TPR) repeat protein
MAVDDARAKSLFLAASDISDPAERAAYLDRECGGDAETRARVEALLRANDAAPLAPLELGDGTSAHDSDRQAQTEDYGDPTARVGSVVAGKYKLIEEIGEGGMGSVYIAQQTAPVKRAVAVKVIKAGMDSKAVLARFDAERQALAMMDHPNIAKVLDAGATESGRPFFVMELVKGTPITQFCDERKLNPRQRLELFVPVCQAIQHAHQKGVIHRDIKPSNVLVAMYDDQPVPKVIDFGVAKAAGQTLTDNTLMTGFGAVVGTPEYMSPEQANLNNMDIDTRSDVYSLGVLLYELLTGSTPVNRKSLGKAALLEILRIVREVEAPRPSAKLSTIDTLASVAANRGTEPAKLSKLMKGELDWLVLKALEKDRTRRYETANALSRDIQRYLTDEVVEARPPSAGYRLKKFVRRHKGQVLAAGLVLFALVAGMAGTTWGLFEAKRSAAAERRARQDAQASERFAVEQRKKAEKARDRTRDVLDAMTSQVTRHSLNTQKEISADQKKFLNEVLTYYREFAGEKADDEQTRARTAAAARRVAAIEYDLGRREEAIAAMQMAQDGYRNLAADFPATASYRHEIAISQRSLGGMLARVGKLEKAEEQLLLAQSGFEKLAADFPAVPDYRAGLADCHIWLGGMPGKGPEAEKQYLKAMALLDKLTADFPAEGEYRIRLGQCHRNLGLLLGRMKRPTEAEEHCRRALSIRAKLVADFPDEPRYQRELAGDHYFLADLLTGLGKRAEAGEHYRKSVPLRERLASDYPSFHAYQTELGVSLHKYGKWVRDDGRHQESLVWFDKAIATVAPAHRSVPQNLKRFLRNIHSDRALACSALNQHVEALKDWDWAVELSPAAEQMEFRAGRATSRMQGGQIAEAVARSPS